MLTRLGDLDKRELALLRLSISYQDCFNGSSVAITGHNAPAWVFPPAMVVILEHDTILCRCLQVSESSLADVVQRCPFANLQDVARETGAGSGCTACHRMIRRFLTQQRNESERSDLQRSDFGCCGS